MSKYRKIRIRFADLANGMDANDADINFGVRSDSTIAVVSAVVEVFTRWARQKPGSTVTPGGCCDLLSLYVDTAEDDMHGIAAFIEERMHDEGSLIDFATLKPTKFRDLHGVVEREFDRFLSLRTASTKAAAQAEAA